MEKKEKGKKKRELIKDQNQLQTNATKITKITLGFSMVNCLLQKLKGAWVQALDAVTCGIVWVDKC